MKAVKREVPLDHPDFGKAFPCPTCQLPEIAARNEREKQERLDALVGSSGISPRHMFSFDDFAALPEETQEGKQYAAELCYLLADRKQVFIDGVGKAGLFLYGEFGTLKTTLGTSALLHVAQNGGAILRVKFADFLDDVKDSYGRKDVQAEDVIRTAQRAPFALVDDLGNPKSQRQLSDDQIRITHKLLEYRNEYMLPTIITSNCVPKQLELQLTKRTFERVRELCHFVEVTGANLRQ